MTFTMSIEVIEGFAYQHPFHLGTVERIARDTVVRQFSDRRHCGMPTVTIGLIYNRKLVDTFYGDKWHSEMCDA